MKKIFVSTIILFLASWIYAEKDYNVDAKTGASMPVQKVETTPSYRLFPANKAKGVPPDTHLTIEFDSPVQLNNKGVIRIYESHTGRLVDTLDMNIPAGPTEPDMIRKQKATYTTEPYPYDSSHSITNANTKAGTPSGTAIRDTTGPYQLTIIGGFSDGFHFYPVIIDGNRATIYPHNNLLEYGKSYYVTIDKEVFTLEKGVFSGIYDRRTWQFSIRKNAPEATRRHLIVNHDGSGDFCTVQGAMDFIPDFSAESWSVFIHNGDYEELVYFRNKKNVLLQGENRDSVLIHYANNETFNPHPLNVKTNEWPGTFPSRRAAFAADNCYDMRFENMTIQTDLRGQAEGLLLMGSRNYLRNVRVVGSGDALQINGSVYLERCIIDGGGDMILGRGPAYFKDCLLKSPGPFMWIRNTEANHGNIFVNCHFIGTRKNTVLARSPLNKLPEGYPYAEAVLINCTLENIAPEGWGNIGGPAHHLRFLEFDSRDKDGNPIDTSRRHPLSKQLRLLADDCLIEMYLDPAKILNWQPEW